MPTDRAYPEVPRGHGSTIEPSGHPPKPTDPRSLILNHFREVLDGEKQRSARLNLDHMGVDPRTKQTIVNGLIKEGIIVVTSHREDQGSAPVTFVSRGKNWGSK